MTTTASKQNKLKGTDFNGQSTSQMFPSDLLDVGQDQQCMTFFINTIKNGKAKINFNGGLVTPKNNLSSAYGEVPVIQVVSTGVTKNNGTSKDWQVFSNTYSRSKESITLPMPKNLRFHQRSNWSKVDLGQTGMVIDQATDFQKAKEHGLALAGMMAGGTVASIADKFKIPGSKALFELGTASVANTYAETLFRNTDNRPFQFSWNLTPRSAKEAQALDTIIRMFRFHMLPELRSDIGNGNAYFAYPSSFDIVFWSEGAPNKYIPRIATCALIDMETDYTPNGGYINTNINSPQSYTLSLSFIELSTLHKALVGTDIGDGTNGSVSGTTF